MKLIKLMSQDGYAKLLTDGMKQKKLVWEEIAQQMRDAGFVLNLENGWNRCYQKWRNLIQKYRHQICLDEDGSLEATDHSDGGEKAEARKRARISERTEARKRAKINERTEARKRAEIMDMAEARKRAEIREKAEASERTEARNMEEMMEIAAVDEEMGLSDKETPRLPSTTNPILSLTATTPLLSAALKARNIVFRKRTSPVSSQEPAISKKSVTIGEFKDESGEQSRDRLDSLISIVVELGRQEQRREEERKGREERHFQQMRQLLEEQHREKMESMKTLIDTMKQLPVFNLNKILDM